MKALVVYCHPKPGSFSEAVRDEVIDGLNAGGAEVDLIDLYAEGFQPVLGSDELDSYEDASLNTKPVARHVAALLASDTLIFIYPTWWYAQPAMLKGWLDRVLVPETAFQLPKGEGDNIKPGLTHIRQLAVFTTCGASWWLTRLIGTPGRKILLRGVRILCDRRVRTHFLAHYSMDSSTPETRRRHLARVRRTTAKLLRSAP